MPINPEQLLQRFSTHLRSVVAKAMALATSLSQDKVTPAHIFVALLEESGSIANEILNKFSIDKKFIYEIIDNQPTLNRPVGQTTTTILPELNLASKKILERSMLIAYERNHAHVGTEHLLLSIIISPDQSIKHILDKYKIARADIEDQVENILQSTSKFPKIEEVTDIMDQLEHLADGESSSPLPLPIMPSARPNPKTRRPTVTALDLFTNNLTDKRNQKNIDPVIGREKEIARVINILSRRTKNNPVLIGEPGVGKTAIVEGLAKKIVEGDVPEILKRKKILSLDMTLLIAGTIYRGEFEARLKQIVDEVSKMPNCILFIDELHNIIGAGSSQGAMDAANILKPALARGNLRCIGATTIDEYKKHVTSDPALERRFQAIEIGEPSEIETLKILQGIKKYYEDFHHVKISPEALSAAVALSTKYIHDNFLPDKAIDLIDEAAASVRVKDKATPEENKRHQLLAELENCSDNKEKAIREEKFDEAIIWKDKEKNLEQNLVALEKKISHSKKPNRKIVTEKNIAQILESRLNISSDILLLNEWEELDSLPAKLKNHIIGQDKAVDKIVRTIKQAHLGLKNKQKPLASFLFVGPSGVGKTELAKILAQELYHDKKALIKLDMSEFSEGHATSKLLGSPAGYIGHKDRNRFTEEIRKRPYCVVLFDEIDKAHRDVSKLLLQILDEGELTDSAGKKTHFHHAVIVLTTNLGADLFKSAGIGFGKGSKDNKDRDKSITNKLKEELSSALINRLDSVCVFEPLSKDSLKIIINKNLQTISQKLKENNQIAFRLTDKILADFVQDTYSEDEGARNMERILQDTIQELIIDILKQTKHKSDYLLTKKSGEYKLV